MTSSEKSSHSQDFGYNFVVFFRNVRWQKIPHLPSRRCVKNAHVNYSLLTEVVTELVYAEGLWQPDCIFSPLNEFISASIITIVFSHMNGAAVLNTVLWSRAHWIHLLYSSTLCMCFCNNQFNECSPYDQYVLGLMERRSERMYWCMRTVTLLNTSDSM